MFSSLLGNLVVEVLTSAIKGKTANRKYRDQKGRNHLC